MASFEITLVGQGDAQAVLQAAVGAARVEQARINGQPVVLDVDEEPAAAEPEPVPSDVE